MSTTTTQDRAERLVEELLKLRDDRGAMANLRRGFSPATEDRAWPWVARWCDLTNDRQRMIYTTVAAAFAAHPQHADSGNLGTTLRQIAHSEQPGEDGLRSFEARFRRLLACNSAEEVCRRISNVVQAAKQRGSPINYERLFKDLWFWDYYGDRIKVSWAAAYSSGRHEEDLL